VWGARDGGGRWGVGRGAGRWGAWVVGAGSSGPEVAVGWEGRGSAGRRGGKRGGGVGGGRGSGGGGGKERPRGGKR